MPIYTVQGPDGKTYDIEGPPGATADQLGQVIRSQQPKPSIFKDAAMGALKGASDIGTTLLTPVAAVANAVGGEGTMLTGDQRRAAIGQVMRENSNPDSLAFKGGEIASGIAGTAGAGGAIANGVRAIPALARVAPGLASAIESGGFSLGGAPAATTGAQMAANAATRLGGGAIAGGAMAGMINPSEAGMGAVIGAGIPVVGKVAGELGRGAKAAFIDPLINKDKLVAAAIQRAVGPGNIPQTVAGLNRAPMTPGVAFSAGEASGNPALNAMEDSFRSLNPGGALNAQAQANRSALAAPVRNIAQDEFALSKAVADREAAVQALYAKAKQANAVSDPALEALFGRPSMQVALSNARNLAQERGESIFTSAPSKPITQYADDMGNIAQNIPKMPAPPQGMRNLVTELINSGGVSRSELADMGIDAAAKTRPGLFRKEGTGKTADDLVEWMQQHGWLNEQDIENANRFATGGSHDLARGMLKDAVEGIPVVHPSQDNLAYEWGAALSDWGKNYGHLAKQEIPGTPAVYPGKALHDIKLGLDDAIGNGVNGLQGEQRRAALDTQEKYLQWLESKIAEYGAARSTYAEKSKPINQMAVGKLLSEKLLPATSGDIPASINAATFARALQNPDQVAKLATGFKASKLADVLTPDQIKAVLGVNSDASRLAEMHKLGAGQGSPTARRQAIGGFIGDNFAEQAPTINRLIGALGSVPGVNYLTRGAAGIGNMLGSKMNEGMSKQLEAMLASDPQGVSNALMRALQQGNGARNPRIEQLLRTAPIAIRATQASP